MKRFNDDDENFNNDYEGYKDGYDDDDNDDRIDPMNGVYASYHDSLSQDDLFGILGIDVRKTELRQALLNQAATIAESNFFFRFRSPLKKTSIILEIYDRLCAVIYENDIDLTIEEKGQ